MCTMHADDSLSKLVPQEEEIRKMLSDMAPSNELHLRAEVVHQH